MTVETREEVNASSADLDGNTPNETAPPPSSIFNLPEGTSAVLESPPPAPDPAAEAPTAAAPESDTSAPKPTLPAANDSRGCRFTFDATCHGGHDRLWLPSRSRQSGESWRWRPNRDLQSAP